MPWTDEEREELEQVRPIKGTEAVGLRVWVLGLSRAVSRYAAGALAHSSRQPEFQDVLDRFANTGRPVAELVEHDSCQVMTPVAFARLLEDAESLELSARSAEEALPHPSGRTPEQAAAGVVCQMAQGLPFQLRAYARAVGGLIQ